MTTSSLNVNFPDALVDWVPPEDTGYPGVWAERDTVEAYAAMEGVIDFPDHLWIEERDWKDVAAQNDQYHTWPDDYRNRRTHQGRSHECTCHCLLQCFEIAWNRQVGREHASWVSALSVYIEANPRQWGGSTMQRTLGIARDRGFLPDHDGSNGRDTQKSLYPTTLHCTAGGNSHSSNGPWVSLRSLPENYRDVAKNFRVLEYINIRDWRQIVCLVLNGYAVGVGRSGHAIPYCKIVWRGGDLFAQYADSYVVDRFDSMRMIKSAVGGAYAIASTTVLENWKTLT